MAFDAYIQIDAIAGEALDEKYNKWIEVTGYYFGVSQSTSATASSAGGARQAALPSAISDSPSFSTAPVAN